MKVIQVNHADIAHRKCNTLILANVVKKSHDTIVTVSMWWKYPLVDFIHIDYSSQFDVPRYRISLLLTRPPVLVKTVLMVAASGL